MKLITEKTTLEEFRADNFWLIEDQFNNRVYCIETVKLEIQAEAWYGWVVQNTATRMSRRIRILGSSTVAVEDKAALLRRIQTKQFEIK